MDPDSVGLNPAWRTALIHAVAGESWPEGTPAGVIQQLRNNLKQDVTKLEALAPGSGSYFNEVRVEVLPAESLSIPNLAALGSQASLYEEHPETTFFGSHYNKLKAIKDIYDPHQLFIVAEGVGSDEWDSTLNCRN